MALVVRRDPISFWGQDVGPGANQGHMTLSASSLTFADTVGGGGSFMQTVAIGTTTGTLIGPSVGTITYGSGSGWVAATIVAGISSTVNVTVTTGALAVGTYTATVPILDAQADNSPQNITVTFTVNAAVQLPIIQPDKSGLFFIGTAGGSAPADQTITVTNLGGTAFAGLALGATVYGSGSGWLTTAINGNTITVSANPAALSAAAYAATFTITDASATNSPVTISVDFTVNAAPIPIISLSPTNLSFAALTGGAVTNPKTIAVTNAGGGSLTALAVGNKVYGVGATGWLTVTVSGSTITATATPGSIAAGNYTATFDVTATGAATVTVGVDFALTNPPVAIMRLTPNNLSFTAIASGAVTAAQAVTIGNVGNAALTGPTLGTPSDTWLVPSISGTDISVYCDPTGLSAGTVTGTVSVDDASAASATLSVTFIVTAAPSPVLNFSGTAANFTAVSGGGDPTPSTITITNSAGAGSSLAGPAVGAKTYTPAGAWLTAAISTVTAGQTYTLTLTPATGALAAGTYSVSFPVTDASASNSPVTITVTFVVTSVTPPGNFPAPLYPIMQGTSSNATFNPVDGKITYNPFTNNGITDPDGNSASAGFYYTGTTRTANSQASLVSALAASADGDIVAINGAFTISSVVTLPAKGAGWVLITSANPCTAAEGDRVAPSNFTASHPYKISCSSTGATFEMAAGSDGWHFRDIWLENTASSEKTSFFNWGFPDNSGNSGNGQRTTAEMPERMKMERCYFNNPFNNSNKYVARHLVMSGRYGMVKQCYFDGGCRNNSSDSQSILITNTLGDIQIEDNFLEGASENVFLGGGRVWMGTQNYNHNIHIRGNYLKKRLAWTTSTTGASGGSTVFKQIKNFFEIKHARYLVFEDNYLENHNGTQTGGSPGQFVDISVKVSPYSTGEVAYIRTSDITIRNNMSVNGVGSIEIDNGDDHAPLPSNALAVGNIEVRNNAFLNRFNSNSGDLRNLIGGKGLSTKRMYGIVLNHNWFGDKNSMMVFTTPTATAGGVYIAGLTVTNNIFWQDLANQAVLGQSVAPNKPALDAVCGAGAWTFAKNAAVHAAGTTDLYGSGSAGLGSAPYSNICYTTTATLTAKTSTATTHRNVLASATDLYQAGTDGKDIGPDWDLLQRAVAATS